ncbi:type II secretion system protein [Arcobacter sp. CECT 8985]|uniref:type II secretion system protein n=1 Tax=Arcobacter sp. CECT 8985 TaxID=1935424 RepID=UPI00100BB2A5|nr:hypothetical protein [Arcobacter sp. CECT 8985]RXJ88134.1 hypothetical protein CRU93_00625 [Arcobacter sp. CECT 8985]
MKRAFSLIEVIFSICLLAIIITLINRNFSNIFNTVDSKKYKIQINQIKSGIKNVNSKRVLSNTKFLTQLDKATINKAGEKLFSNVLKNAIISSNNSWMKYNKNSYSLKLNNSKVNFKYKNNTFMCISKNEICKEFQ